MGGLTNASSSSTVQSFRYQTSEQGSVIPICYGWNRVSPNLIEAFNLNPGGAGKGGKGGSSGGKGKSDNTQYSVDVAFGICQGPIAGVNQVWASQGVSDLGALGLSLYGGADGQSPDPVFETSDPNQPVLGYSGCNCAARRHCRISASRPRAFAPPAAAPRPSTPTRPTSSSIS
jgi:hypothetical protein